jgi:hypothetical protein
LSAGAKIMLEPPVLPADFRTVPDIISILCELQLKIVANSPFLVLVQPCGDDSVPSLTVKVTYEDHGVSILTEKCRLGLQAIGQNPYIQGHSLRAFGSHLIGDRAVTSKRAAHRTFF